MATIANTSDELLVGPIRGDLLGADHLAARARSVARSQRLASGSLPLRPARLLARLAETRRILSDARDRLLSETADGVEAGPAAEWLLDNYYVVQEHLQEIRTSLPGGYYRELPELDSGPLAGYPRVYEIAIALISHTEARVDLENVDLFVEAFQGVTSLSVRELWAMPAMLRLGLIESVRRMTLRTVQRLDEIELAAQWADRLSAATARGGAELRATVEEFTEAELTLSPHFISRLLQSLRQSEGVSPSLVWLEHWMRESGGSPENAVAQSTQRLALTQLMMANSIMSLRDIGRCDWKKFVEKQSVMEAVLREDPSGFYPQMTFATRDTYRHVIERIAKRTDRSEESIAQAVLDLARRGPQSPLDAADPRRKHVGFYLVDEGLEELEHLTRYSPTMKETVERAVHAHPNATFIGGLALFTLLALLAVLIVIDAPARAAWGLVLLFCALPALDIAVSVVTQLVTTWLPPRTLPRLDLHVGGVPPEYRTAVVIPVLFGSVEDVYEALENVEVQFLANREAHLHFAILSDFTDAPSETQPADDAIVQAALEGIRELNERHGTADEPEPFYLLHRPRRWNPQQGVWMGWERKRGKLSDFNRLVRGNARDAFSIVTGDVTRLRDVRYVITLDADTVLPPDAAPELVGAMAHPLNRAVYDPDRGSVVLGYGILQPRVGVSLPSANRSRFAAIASGHPGVDPYSTAVSDVYQDLYGEGSFTGKGIYDVDAFQLATQGRFPENTLLSHDLIEGNYARAGLATDVKVYDDYPSTYEAYTRRKHRWIRGDWQLLPWLRRMVPGRDGPERNRLSIVAQWKIIDNLRRSTVEIAQVLLFIAGWTILPGSVVRWTLLGIGAVVAPWVVSLLLAIVRPPIDKSWRAYYAEVGRDALVSLQQAAVALVFLPHQAVVSADAIIRTLYRLLVSRRRLLEWQSASVVERDVSGRPTSQARGLVPTTLAIAAGALFISWMAIQRHTATGLALDVFVTPLVVAWAVVACWLAAPGMARWLGHQATPEQARLSDSARATAARYARLHWGFFEKFVNESTHWLAPDNFQLDPAPVVAMRTSPTNIGLQLMATVSARDLGFIDTAEMVTRLERAFDTMRTLRRYRGHFYNWYDLHDLRVLEPPYISTVDSGNMAGHLVALRQACLHFADMESEHEARLLALAEQAYAWVQEMDFGFLYDRVRHLFTIGYHPDSYTADDSHYDLLASEARLTSFLAIARNDVPVEHWFHLSRALTRTAGTTSLVSWSGSMFEYLMPMLVMRVLPHTLLAQACEGVVARQMAYARSRQVPWGISESAYNVRDHQHTYQYRAFGVPDLALKRGLGRDLVIAPYATALAALVDPAEALANLATLESLGALGEYGFFDALDYTRPDKGKPFSLVQTNMAHHVGMTLVALANVLQDDAWLERFHADPLVKSAELLLHERVPRRLVMREAQTARPEEARQGLQDNQPVVREIDTSKDAAPRAALLGSVPYAVMLNHSGSGYSRYDALAVTRWRADSTADDSGQFCYLRDVSEGRVWSAGRQPVDTPADWSRAWLASDRVTLQRADGDIMTRTDITVVPADAAEVRRITVTNTGREPREIELTSYGEVVMAPPGADRAHPAFSNLFVETEWHAWCTAITATRRPRARGEPQLWCVHVVDAGRDRVGEVTYETDRAAFIGRGHSVRNPVALERDGALSGTTGAVLDPIFALRVRVRVMPGQSTSVSFTTLVATNRESAFELAGRYHESHSAQRALDLAWTSSQIELRELGITPASAADFQDIATQLLFPGGSLAPPQDELRRNRSSQPTLWQHGISGDLPIVLATIDSPDGLSTLHALLQAHRFWRRRGLVVDLVVINARPHDYLQELRDGITEAMVSANDAMLVDQPGGVFVRRRDQLKTDEYLMLSATARVHIPCDGRTLSRILGSAEQASEAVPAEAETRDREQELMPVNAPPAERSGPLEAIVSVLRPLVKPLLPRASRTEGPTYETLASRMTLRFANGIGGLDERGDYQMVVDGEHLPPAPWANVIANQHGGFLVTERGAGCTWAENAYFYRLSPWHNDPVSDPVSDVLYIKDADSGDVWSATPAPIDDGAPYRVRHGAGSSTFEHEHDGVRTELLLGIPPDGAVKVSVLRIRNGSDRPRRLSLTAYCEWILGARKEDSQLHVRTRFVAEQHAIFARNLFDPSFAGWTAYLAISEPVTSFTGDRLSFLGRYGNTARPAALAGDDLDGTTGVGVDPCGALQAPVLLAPGETREITVLLGAAASDREARLQLERLQAPARAREAVMRTISLWSARLSVITVRTPEPAFDAMLNKWSLYQALGCRMWARTGLYQSSGAYGFRDQLQDAMAMVYAEPGVARDHILRAAARQFLEGDVQHWWHPHTGRGVRTRFSDDLAWLPYVVDHYVRATGDESVLDQYVPFLTMRELEPHEHEIYDLPTVTDEYGSVYEHCLRALRRASTRGPHGLPLIGTGDWNDGMSRVGAEGRGESVWLAWFLIATSRAFALRAEARGDHGAAEELRLKADAYVRAVETSGWDGHWYRRAYYDDGTPMGSSANDECRIDSIAQSWSVISGAGAKARQESAMRALEAQLVDEDARLIMLLTPPFDRGEHDPGYIRGYVPGVRENGAQYTHAALWAVLATALRGDGERAFELFQMLNPLTHTSSAEGVARYKVEPYVIAADVYTAPGHLGRGGWTWYTGSASWMYRVGVEAILGLQKVGNTLRVVPSVPPAWREYEIAYRFGSTTYTIAVRNPAEVQARGGRVTIDGHRTDDDVIHLVDDGRRHSVIIEAAAVALDASRDHEAASRN